MVLLVFVRRCSIFKKKDSSCQQEWKKNKTGLVFSPCVAGRKKKSMVLSFCYFFPLCLFAPSDRLRSRFGKDNGQTKKSKKK